jgi:predicted alpha/beta hydrolase
VDDAREYNQEYLERDGERIGLQVYPDGGTGPAVVVWPAMGTPARYYRHFAAQLAGAGLGVTVVDMRGTGASTPRPDRASRYGYAELVADVGAVLDRQRRPTLLLGHSLGGQACALYLARTGDPRVSGLALVAAGLPYWRAYPGRRRYSVRLFAQGIGVTSAVLGVWPGWGFGGRQARGVMRDWSYTARRGRYPRLDGTDPEALLGTVSTPVLAVSVDGDRFTPPSTVDHLAGKLAGAPVERVHYTADEAGAALDHFRWTRAGGALATRIAAFAERVAGAGPADPGPTQS